MFEIQERRKSTATIKSTQGTDSIKDSLVDEIKSYKSDQTPVAKSCKKDALQDSIVIDLRLRSLRLHL